MHESMHGLRSSYKRGCRCDLCKQAESEYKRDLRRRQREEVGQFVTHRVTSLSLVNGEGLTSGNGSANYLGAVESAVAQEIEGFGAHRRPGLAAAALALARVLDNAKAVSSQPAAAAKMVHILDQLRKCAAVSKQTPLAAVRQMTAKTRGPDG